MAKSGPKGKRYEYRVVELLSTFCGKKFRRVPSSGAFNKTGGVVICEHIFSGDVICEDEGFLFNVEAKNRNDISLAAALKTPDTSMLVKCWRQCVGDATTNNLLPMMFFKPNPNDDWVCINDVAAAKLGIDGSMNRMIIFISKDTSLPDIIIMDWRKFAQVVDYKLLFCNKS